MGATATKERSELDDKALAEELENERGGEDDGLGPVDPNGEEQTGVPGGAQPGDDQYQPPDPGAEPPTPEPTDAVAGGSEPPTPPADLPQATEEEESGDQLFLDGTRPIGVKVGGRKPDSAILKFKGAKVDLGGQYDRADRITTVDIWQVTGDNDQDTIDTLSGDVKSTSKAQNATLCGTRLIEDWLFERLNGEMPAETVAQVFETLELDVPEV